MFRVLVKRPAVAVGQKGYRKQQIGVVLIDANGQEDDFPSRVDVLRGPDEKDYPPGEYLISPSSFGIKTNEFGSAELGVTRLLLHPVGTKK